jgi:hypothetical protein
VTCRTKKPALGPLLAIETRGRRLAPADAGTAASSSSRAICTKRRRQKPDGAWWKRRLMSDETAHGIERFRMDYARACTLAMSAATMAATEPKNATVVAMKKKVIMAAPVVGLRYGTHFRQAARARPPESDESRKTRREVR